MKCATRVRADADADAPYVRLVKPCTLYYRGEIKEPQATQFAIKLRRAAKCVRGSRRRVRIYLSSEGGDAYAGISLYETVKMVARKTPVDVVVDGFAASAATLPLLAATRRFLCRSAFLLVHAVTAETWGGYKPKQLQEEADNLRTLQRVLHGLYSEHCTLSKKELRKLLDKDRLMPYDECVRCGFVDGDPAEL